MQIRKPMYCRRVQTPYLASLIFACASPAFATVTVQLMSNYQNVALGTPITFTATAQDSTNQNATFTYQFSVNNGSGSCTLGSQTCSLVKDFYYTNTVTWAPTDHEGNYTMQVIAHSSTGAQGSALEPITVNSRVTGNMPVITPTYNPLVALYSAPPCSPPAQVRVVFSSFSSAHPGGQQSTNFKPCTNLSVNFYIAGMQQQTTYGMQEDVRNGNSDTFSGVLRFTTGSLPNNVPFPSITTIKGPTQPTATTFPFVTEFPDNYPFVSDLTGDIVWYTTAYSNANPQETGYLFRDTNVGTFIGTQDDPNDLCPGSNKYCGDHQFLREWDLAGNIVRETNWTIVNQEINAIRAKNNKAPVHAHYFSHEGWRLANGYTATMLTDEEIANQGNGPVDVFGDIIVVLDTNLQVVWLWDAFDALPITRQAQLNNTCVDQGPGCPPILLKQSNGQYYTVANDWTHCNSIAYSPSDGNLIVSVRHQSWIVKLAYENGEGDAHIVWILGDWGNQGCYGHPCFSLASSYPATDWFTYQHDAQYQSDGILTLFDNGDLRVAENNGSGDSRGQGWSLDETNLIATPVANYDLGVYSQAVGYATILPNGNYDFGASFVNQQDTFTFEFTPPNNNQLVYEQEVGMRFSYRPMRLPNLYTQR